MITSIIISGCVLAFIIALMFCQRAKDFRCKECGKVIEKGKDYCERCEK